MSEQNFNGVTKVYSRDEISTFSDRELAEATREVKQCIREARRSGRDSTNLEIEFCYLDNERQRREKLGFSTAKPQSSNRSRGPRSNKTYRS